MILKYIKGEPASLVIKSHLSVLLPVSIVSSDTYLYYDD